MNKKTIITILFALLIIPMGVEAKKKIKERRNTTVIELSLCRA